MTTVAHLITGLEVGGTETMLLETLRRMRDKELRHVVFCVMGQGPIGQALQEIGIPVVYLEYRRWYDGVRTVVRLWRHWRRERPRLVVTYLIHADLLGRLVAPFTGISRVIAYKHGALLQWEFLKYFDSFSRGLVKRYLAVSTVLREKLIHEYHISPDQIVVIPNGIDLEPYAKSYPTTQLRAELGVTDHVVFGVVAALRPGKGHADLLHSFKALREAFPTKKLSLLFAGVGSEQPVLTDLVKTLSLGNSVQFLGYRQDIPALLSIMDVFVLPTYFEGMSVALLQAMAAAKPIVTTSIAENKELVTDGETALLVRAGDRPGLTQALQQLMNDPAMGARLGAQARRICQAKYDILTTVKNFKQVLVSL